MAEAHEDDLIWFDIKKSFTECSAKGKLLFIIENRLNVKGLHFPNCYLFVKKCIQIVFNSSLILHEKQKNVCLCVAFIYSGKHWLRLKNY